MEDVWDTMSYSLKLTLKNLMRALGFGPFFLWPLWPAFPSLDANEDLRKLQVNQINQPIFHQSLASMSWEKGLRFLIATKVGPGLIK